jgi:periplasmic copper chaperone A
MLSATAQRSIHSNQETTMQRTISLIAGVLGLALTAAFAGDVKVGSLSVSNPWSTATPKGASVAVGYMNIANSGTAPDRLISGSSDISAKLEMHNMTMDNGVMKMRPVEGGIEIKPGATVEFKPGSFHLMFVDLKRPLAANDHIKAALVFEKAGTVNVEFDVLPMGATPGHTMPKAQMPGMNMPGH